MILVNLIKEMVLNTIKWKKSVHVADHLG